MGTSAGGESTQGVPWEIRQLAEEDVAGVAALLARQERLMPRAAIAKVRGWLAERTGATFIAAQGTRIIGHARVVYLDPGARGGTAPEGWYLGGIVVDPTAYKVELGWQLIAIRLMWLKGRTDAVWFFTDAGNEAALELHARAGFTPVTSDVVVPGVRFGAKGGILCGAALSTALLALQRRSPSGGTRRVVSGATQSRGVPRWAWAVGGLAAVLLLVGVFLGGTSQGARLLGQVSVATWVVPKGPEGQPAVNPKDDVLTIEVLRVGCEGAESDQVLAPQVVESADKVVITANLVPWPRWGGTCPLRPAIYDVRLAKPVGNRTLVDGACVEFGNQLGYDRRCRADRGVRWTPGAGSTSPATPAATPSNNLPTFGAP